MKNKKFLAVIGLAMCAGALTGCGGDAAATSVTVKAADDVTSIEVGKTVQLSATVAPASISQDVTWSIDNSTYASISTAGLVTGLAAGNVVVKATSKVTSTVFGTLPLTISAAEYKPDLTDSVTLKLSVNYDNKNKYMKYDKDTPYTTPKGTVIKNGDFKPVWQSLQKKLNFVVDDVTDTSTNATGYFKSNWQTNQFADMACGNVTDMVDFSVKGTSETILDINEYMQYMPNFSKFLSENPIVRQSIMTGKFKDDTKTGIYYLPYFDGFSDLEKMTMLRADYVRKILDTDFDSVDWDTDTSIWKSDKYKATCDDSYDLTVAASMDTTGTKTIKKAKVTNIVTQQNALSASDRCSKIMVKQFRQYMADKYGTQYKTLSDLFLGVDASYDADEMVALMRIVRVSPKALTGNNKTEMVPFVPRENNNQRIADMYRWAGQMWGVRGVESRCGYLYIDGNGKIQDARGDEATTKMLENLNALYDEGLILKDFEKASNYGVTNGKYAEKIVVGGNADYSGFMEYDYSQTQGVWNDKAGSTAIADYDFRPIIGAAAKWNGKSTYQQFTESWRSVKSQGWCLNASLKNDEKKLMRALALADYFYSDEGQQLNSYGPESEEYTSGTINYQGRTVAKFTDKALAQLNDKSIGAGNYTNYLRIFVGATLPVGYVKEQGMEYQCTSEKAKNGLAIINKALEVGTYKHVECAITDDPFYRICPSSFLLSSSEVETKTELETNKLGLINSNGSSSSYNPWDTMVMTGSYGAYGTNTITTSAQYLTQINETWGLKKLIKIYQDAYDFMTL